MQTYIVEFENNLVANFQPLILVIILEQFIVDSAYNLATL